jgi:hypothetical protein
MHSVWLNSNNTMPISEDTDFLSRSTSSSVLISQCIEAWQLFILKINKCMCAFAKHKHTSCACPLCSSLRFSILWRQDMLKSVFLFIFDEVCLFCLLFYFIFILISSIFSDNSKVFPQPSERQESDHFH